MARPLHLLPLLLPPSPLSGRATIFFAASLICEASLSNDISILNLQGGEYHGYLINGCTGLRTDIKYNLLALFCPFLLLLQKNP